jgi:uncharacterized membrane protein
MRLRYLFLDSLRGFALLLMSVYHFAFDLYLFGFWHIHLHDPFWNVYRYAVLGTFLALMGIGISLSGRDKPDLPRLIRILFGASLISLATWILFRDEWVYFGVLHFILVASLIAPPLARFPRFCALAGVVITILPAILESSGIQSFLLGVHTERLRTIDFVPLCPWLGIVLIGIFLGSQITQEKKPWLSQGSELLALFGRHSLMFYIIHQVVLLPLAWLVTRI